MDQNAKKQREQKEYQEYVKTVTPVHNLWMNMAKAFVTGGVICMIGQGILNYCKAAGLDKENQCRLVRSGIGIFIGTFDRVKYLPRIAKWGGAGALVPITGFANSVAAPAIEYKKEGQVMGIGCKIFTIAGPVILYGTVISWTLGLVWWLGSFL